MLVGDAVLVAVLVAADVAVDVPHRLGRRDRRKYVACDWLTN